MSRTETPAGPLGLPEDVCEELYSSRRRCLLLCVLGDAGPLAVTDLATRVRAEELATGEGQISRDQRERVVADMFDRHLPKLTAVGVVEFDSQLGKVRLVEPEAVALAERAIEQHPVTPRRE